MKRFAVMLVVAAAVSGAAPVAAVAAPLEAGGVCGLPVLLVPYC